MKIAANVKDQASAINALGSLLHLERSQIAVLIVTEDHPLPLPQKIAHDGSFVFNRAYLYQLVKWVRCEKNSAVSYLPESYDFDLIDHELCEKAITARDEITWSIKNLFENYPPGHFLG